MSMSDRIALEGCLAKIRSRREAIHAHKPRIRMRRAPILMHSSVAQEFLKKGILKDWDKSDGFPTINGIEVAIDDGCKPWRIDHV